MKCIRFYGSLDFKNLKSIRPITYFNLLMFLFEKVKQKIQHLIKNKQYFH